MKLLIQCHNLQFLRSRRKTNLKLDLMGFNIFGSSEYEKMEIFFKTVKFCFAHIKLFKKKKTKSIKTVCSLMF